MTVWRRLYGAATAVMMVAACAGGDDDRPIARLVITPAPIAEDGSVPDGTEAICLFDGPLDGDECGPYFVIENDGVEFPERTELDLLVESDDPDGDGPQSAVVLVKPDVDVCVGTSPSSKNCRPAQRINSEMFEIDSHG